MSDVAFTTYRPGDGGHVEVLFNQGDGTLAAPPTQPVTPFGFFPGPIVATDSNGDGLPDLAVHSTENPIVLAFLNEGAGVLSAPISSVGGSAALYWDAQAADLNGDGLPDLAVPVHGGVDVGRTRAAAPSAPRTTTMKAGSPARRIPERRWGD